MKLGRLPAFLHADIQSQSVQQSSKSRSDLQPSTSVDSMAALLEEEKRAHFEEALDSIDVQTRSAQEPCPLRMDGASYKHKFGVAFQYLQRRCQHHIHKLVTGKRVVPNACRSKAKPTECKYEAPWTNRVSPSWMTMPLLICKGIAKQFKLRCSGMRNWLGQTLLLRNDACVNGTMPGLCMAFRCGKLLVRS